MFTNDKIIRKALLEYLTGLHSGDSKLRIVEELSVKQGAARVDIAVINGVLHGYEIKSDRDTLLRLPDQMNLYNSVFGQLTLVVGKSHLHEAINLIPSWWGIMIAKIDTNGNVMLQTIRVAKDNLHQENSAIAGLLWRNEALELLECAGQAQGFRSKPRVAIYEKLSTVFNQCSLEQKVREVLFSREDWKVGSLPVPCGD